MANAGGVIDFHQETIDDQPDAVLASVARIGAITRDVLRRAAAAGVTPLSIADGIVRARIRQASEHLPKRVPVEHRRRVRSIWRQPRLKRRSQANTLYLPEASSFISDERATK